MPDTTEQWGTVPPLPTRAVGAYELTSRLGRGRAGERFLARRPGIERWFALELADEGLTPDAVARARAEAERASRVEHVAAVRPVDLGMHQGRLFVVYEHVVGASLAERLADGPLLWREATQLGAEVAEVLQAALKVGVAHPGLDPEHVLFDGRGGRARVAGLGADAAAGAGVAAVRAVGALVYAAASGAPPGASPRPLRDVPPELDALCRSALAQRGPATPGALAAALRGATEDVLETSLLTASGSSRGASQPPLSRAAAVAAAWALSLAVTAGWGWWEHGQRLSAQRRERDAQAERAAQQARLSAHELQLPQLTAELDAERARGERSAVELARVEDALAEATLQARRQAEAARRVEEALAGVQRGRDAAAAALAAAIDHLIAALAEAPPDSLALRALLLHNRGRFSECIALLEPALAAGGADPRLRVLLGRAAFKGGDRARGTALLRQVARETPDSAGGLFARVVIGAAPREAADLLRRALQLDPQAGYPAVLLAQLLQGEALRRREPALAAAALRVAEEAVTRDPTSYQAYYQRSSARYHLWILRGRRSSEPARQVIADLVRARALHPDPTYWLWAGKSYLEMLDDPVAARYELEEARRRADLAGGADLRAAVHAFLGAAHLLSGDEDTAGTCWAEALRLAPDSQAAYSFVPYLRRVSPEAQAQALSKLPQELRQRVERAARAR